MHMQLCRIEYIHSKCFIHRFVALGGTVASPPHYDAASMFSCEGLQLVVLQRLEARELPHGHWAKDEPNKLH